MVSLFVFDLFYVVVVDFDVLYGVVCDSMMSYVAWIVATELFHM